MNNDSSDGVPTFIQRVLSIIKIIPEFVCGLLSVWPAFLISGFVFAILVIFIPALRNGLFATIIILVAFLSLGSLSLLIPKLFSFTRIRAMAWRAGVIVGLILLGISIGLASLSGHGSRSPNAAIMATLNHARAEAELHFDTHSASYEGFCLSDTYQRMTEYVNSEFDTTLVCFDAVNGYAIEAPLVSTEGYYCAGANQQPVRTSGNTIGEKDFVCGDGAK